MGEGDVLVLEFTHTPAELQEILMNDGVLRGVTNEPSNTFNEPAFPQTAYGRPYVFIEPQYHQVLRFLTDVGVRRAQHHWVWDSMPQCFLSLLMLSLGVGWSHWSPPFHVDAMPM